MHAPLFEYLRFFFQLISGSRLEHERMLAGLRERDTRAHLDPERPLRILDLANGRLRPQFELLKGNTSWVVGIDLLNRPGQSFPDYAYRFARWAYRRQVPGAASSNGAPRLVCGNVLALPFENESFDFVTSIAAFEHFPDVQTVVSEMQRILRPGGMIWILVHPFTSLSGGHNISRTEVPLRHLPAGVEPWDHLRKRKLPFSVPLNELRISDYLQAVSRNFGILKSYCAIREGDEFLSPALLNELAGYSADELTCAAYVIVAQKPD